MRLFNFSKKQKQEEQNDMAKIDEILKDLSENEKAELKERLGKDDGTTAAAKEANPDVKDSGGNTQAVDPQPVDDGAAQKEGNGEEGKQSAKEGATGENKEPVKNEEPYDARADVAALKEEISKLREAVAAANSKPAEVKDDKTKSNLDEVKQLYLN